jgi:predicted amidohydrolase
MSSKLRVGLVQLAVGANKQENIDNVLKLIDQTDDANLVVRILFKRGEIHAKHLK